MQISAPSAGSGVRAGLTTGTLVETETGWRAAEALSAGDAVHTLGGAVQPIRSVEKTCYGTSVFSLFPRGLVLVPGGALGNCETFYLLPETHVLLSGTAIAALTGDSVALVSAADLVGYRGIVRALPVDGIEAMRLVFDEDEVIFANSGVLIHCPAADAEAGQVSGLFPTLTRNAAQVLMSCEPVVDQPPASALQPSRKKHSRSRKARAAA